MNINDHVSKVQAQLDAAAALGDERTREIASALGTAAAAAVRLAIQDALSAAAAEANAALFAASGGHPAPAISFIVSGDTVRASVTSPPASDEDAGNSRPDDGDASARITLRLSEALKADIEDAAARADASVNTWLVRVASAAARNEGPFGGWGGWKSWAGPGGFGGWTPGHVAKGGNRMTGWVTG